MTAFVRVRAETQTNCTGVVETPGVFMGEAEMPYFCTVAADTPPYCNGVTGNPPLVQKKLNGLMTTLEKEIMSS